MPDQSGTNDLERSQGVFRKTAMWIVFFLTLCIIGCVFFAFVKYGQADKLWIPVAKEHFAAVVGLPSAVLGSLCVVLVLEFAGGPIEVEAFGFKFKGAAGPIVFWLICFLGMASAIKWLWELH